MKNVLWMMILTLSCCQSNSYSQEKDEGKQMNSTPSATEFVGMYNIDPDVLKANGEKVANDSCLCLKKGLDRPSYNEACRVGDMIELHSRRLSIAKKDLYCEPRTDDRTIYFGFRKLEKDLTLEHLQELKKLLSKNAPDWRIAVMGINPETTIIVYPTAIVFPTKGNPDEELESVRSKLVVHKDSTQGALIRQKEWVQRLLFKAAVHNTFDIEKGPQVIAMFDNQSGDEEYYCIWLLNGDGTRSVQWWPPDDEENSCSAMSFYDLSKTGETAPIYELKLENYVGVVECLVVKKNFSKKILFESNWDSESRVQQLKDRKSIEIDLSGIEVISDQEVKKRLEER